MQACQTCSNIHDGPCPQASPIQLRSGHVLQSRYQILHVLGQGGMGTVFMAQDLRLKGRSCVVKKLRDDFYREEDRQKAQAFFEREMQVLSELRHPNIVQILDFFAEGGDYYLVMEYVQGNNLYTMLHEERRGEPFPQKIVLEWVEQICGVLSYLHAQNPPVIYRDLKPSNIMIDLNDTVKLVDFGIARTYEEKGEHTHVVSAGYSPPEQYWGAADQRSDIYSLGATMHFLLTGRDPEALNVCTPRAFNPGISQAVDEIVQQATAQDPNDRYQSIEDFREALLHHEYQKAPDTPRSRVLEIVAGIAVLALSAIIFLVEPLLQADPDRKPGAARLTSERNEAPMDAGSTAKNGGGGSSAANATDLAVQVMDEKDLSDPEGFIEPKH